MSPNEIALVRRHRGWHRQSVERLRKVTVRVPGTLLRNARAACGQGATGTIRRGLELVAAEAAYARVRRMRGRLALDLDLDELRADR